MFNVNQRIKAFSDLGQIIKTYALSPEDYALPYANELAKAVQFAEVKNPWFTKEFILLTLKNWGELLNEKQLSDWTSNYSFKESNKKVAVIMAGNIPMVGFHDLLSVLLSGNAVKIKLSSSDDVLIPALIAILNDLDDNFTNVVDVVTERLEDFDAVIATGSNNSARYFETYFSKYPNIIRKNKTSIAVINETTTDEQIKGLADDIMLYFGLGCRNVTQVFIPQDFDLNRIFEALFKFGYYTEHHKYINNYDYHKAIFLMNQDDILENGFFMMKEDDTLFAPISTLFYKRYSGQEELESMLTKNKDEIQAQVGIDIEFGKAQYPELADYADGVDTMKFLEAL